MLGLEPKGITDGRMNIYTHTLGRGCFKPAAEERFRPLWLQLTTITQRPALREGVSVVCTANVTKEYWSTNSRAEDEQQQKRQELRNEFLLSG